MLTLVGCMFVFNSCGTDPCENFTQDCVNGQCADDGLGNAFCNCFAGYELDANGACTVQTTDLCADITCEGNEACVDGVCVDQCDGVVCPANSTCALEAGEVVCNCDEGYEPNGELCLPACGEGYVLNADSSGCELVDIRVLMEGDYLQTDSDCSSGLDSTLVNYATVETLISGDSLVVIFYNFANFADATSNDGLSVSLSTDGFEYDPTNNVYSIGFMVAQQIVNGVTVEGNTTGTFQYFVDTDDASFVFGFTATGTGFSDTCIAVLNKIDE